MKNIIRIILAFFSVVASYFYIWGTSLFIPGAQNIPVISMIVSLLIASMIGFFIWKQTGTISKGLSKYIIMGGVITGSIGFIIGYFGPIIFWPYSNQGPLLGIIITGPIGFIIGLVGGGIYWLIKVKNKKN